MDGFFATVVVVVEELLLLLPPDMLVVPLEAEPLDAALPPEELWLLPELELPLARLFDAEADFVGVAAADEAPLLPPLLLPLEPLLLPLELEPPPVRPMSAST